MKRRNQLFEIVTICAIGCVLVLFYYFTDARYSALFPKCPFFVLTGLYCPGCGSQRAISALLHGELVQAAGYNFMFTASLLFVIYSASVKVMNIFRTKPLTQAIFYSPLFVKLFIIILVLFAVSRNIAVYPFNVLAP